MQLTLLQEIRPFEFDWWSGHAEPYEACFVYRIDDPATGRSGGEIAIAFGWRPAFGSNRRRVLVFRRPKGVLIEPVGVDDYPDSQILAWMLKRPGSNHNIAREEDIPSDYRNFELAPCIKWITGPSARSGYAALVHEDDHESMIRLALVREQHRAQEPIVATQEKFEAEPESADDTPSAPLPIVNRSVLMKLASYSKEYLEDHLLGSVAEFTGTRLGSVEQAFASLSPPVASLSMLVGYYAFARSGAERAGYNLACVSVLAPYLKEADSNQFWRDFPEWDVFHRAFVNDCDRRKIRQNEKINPRLVRDIYTLASHQPDGGLFHVWADRVRDDGSVRGLFSELMGVHGIKDKIASFICRDVVFLAGLEGLIPVPERKHLQPVDIWIGRIAEFLNPQITFGKDKPSTISDFLAAACTQAGVSGIAFNQGAWYFGSQVAGSANRLTRLLGELDNRPTHETKPSLRRGRLIVIACGKRKIWQDIPDRGPCQAKDAYTGPFFTSNRRYAERFGSDGWMILSSRFGFLFPDTIISNYETTFLDPTTGPIEMDQLRVSAQQAGVTAYEEVEVLGGGEYVQRMREALRSYPAQVLAPYADCEGIGVMMGRAKQAVASGVPMDRLVNSDSRKADQAGDQRFQARSTRGRGRPSETSNPSFIRRAFELNLSAGLSQGVALSKAAEEFGLTLPPSYEKYPGVHFHRWRSQGHGQEGDR